MQRLETSTDGLFDPSLRGAVIIARSLTRDGRGEISEAEMPTPKRTRERRGIAPLRETIPGAERAKPRRSTTWP